MGWIRNWYENCMASEPIVVRLPDPLVAELDALVQSGPYENRVAVVRAGIETIVALERGRKVDDAIVEGHRRRPPTSTEGAAAVESLRQAIAEEPW